MPARHKTTLRRTTRALSSGLFARLASKRQGYQLLAAAQEPTAESVDPICTSPEIKNVAQTMPTTAQDMPTTVKPAVFSDLQASPKKTAGVPVAPLMDVNLKISVVLGETEMSLGELLKLAEGSVVELNNSTGEPIQILVNGRAYAKGDIVVIDDVFGVRISELIDPHQKG